MSKDIVGKPRLSLIPMLALNEVAFVREYGERKYGGAQNYLNEEPIVFIDAALRHLYKHAQSEHFDPESGELHLAHAACSVLLGLDILVRKHMVEETYPEYTGSLESLYDAVPDSYDLDMGKLYAHDDETDGGAGS